MAFADDVAYDKANTYFNTSEFAYAGTAYAPGDDTPISFKYLQRDLPDLSTHERRAIWANADIGAVEKNWEITTHDGGGRWRVFSTGTDTRGKLELELRRTLSKD